MRYAGVIDEDLYVFLPEELLENCFNVLRIRHITLEGTRITSSTDNVTSNRLGLFLVNVQDSNTSTAPRKPLDNSASDATGASSDDRNFTVQTERVHGGGFGAHNEIPLFHGIKSFWANSSAFVRLIPLAN